MKLDWVTITGADDSIWPDDLVELTKEFPFVEWGILLSQSRVGTARYPSFRWLLRLEELVAITTWETNLSCHVCGLWARELVCGRWSLPWKMDGLPTMFGRAQINFSAGPGDDADELDSALGRWTKEGNYPRQFIIQHNQANSEFFPTLRENPDPLYSLVPLFDRSGGKGELPSEWPKADYVDVTPGEHGSGVEIPIYHGYAGGLNPDNLESQLPLIAAAAGDAPFWIDMESGVRAADGTFDLAKVRRCLEIAKPFIRS